VDFHRRPVAEPVPDDIPTPTPRRAEALAALAAIQSLPEAYRETLVLRLVEGMTGDEIARRTGLTPASVRVNLHRGMKRLREVLECKRGGR
jgi:RNA polymerase sigma-70 factor (ECF subfamily)